MKLKLALAAAIVLLLAAKTSVFGDHRALAGLVSVLILAALIWRVLPGGAKTLTGHAHGSDRPQIARHEGGHYVVVKELGGKIRGAAMGDDWGYVAADWPDDKNPVKAVAFYAGGQVAAGTKKGCGHDDNEIRKELRRVPSRDRGRVEREGFALARKIVSSRSGELHRVARKLEEKGRL